MVLRGTGTFRPTSPVVFVQVSGGLAECELLEKAVRRGPLERELDFYYHPHVTVAHHVGEEDLDRAFNELADFECRFEVSDFHLYEHGQDGVWRPVRTFTLDGA
jgi:2'-5' RNA ligase